MASNEFTSGPLRDFSSIEAGTFGFSDIELLSDSGHNNVYRAKMSGKWVVLKTAKQEEGAFTRNQLLFLPRSITNHAHYHSSTCQLREIYLIILDFSPDIYLTST